MDLTVSKAEFARRAGVSRPAIARQTRPGASLADALVRIGGRDMLNMSHSAAIEYLQKHGRKATGARPVTANGASKRRRGRPRKEREYNLDMDIDELLTAELGDDAAAVFAKLKHVDLPSDPTDFYSWDLRRVVGTFGTSQNFKLYLDAVKLIEAIDGQRVVNAAKKGDLVNREAINLALWGPLRNLFYRLLTDVSKTVARTLVNKVKAGEPLEKLELIVYDRIKQEIDGFQQRTDDALKAIDTPEGPRP